MIAKRLSKAPRRPKMSPEALEEAIQELEAERAMTSNLTLADEREMLQRISRMESRKSEVQEYAEFNEGITALRTHIESLDAQLDELNAIIAEQKSGVKLARQLDKLSSLHGGREVQPSELQEQTLEIPADTAPRVVGRGGSMLEALCQHFKCIVEVDSKPAGGVCGVQLVGLADAVRKAAAAVQAMVSEESTRVDMPPGALALLLRDNAALAREIELANFVRVRVERKDGYVMLEGGNAGAAKAALQKLAASGVVVSMPGSALPAVIGRGGSHLIDLRAAFPVEVDALSTTDSERVLRKAGEPTTDEAGLPRAAMLVFAAEQADAEAAAQRLRELVAENEEHTQRLPMHVLMAGWLLEDNAKRIKQFQKKHRVWVKLLRAGEAGRTAEDTAVSVRGTSAALEEAVPAFRQLQHEFSTQLQVLPLQAGIARALVQNSGQGKEALLAAVPGKVELIILLPPDDSGKHSHTKRGALGALEATLVPGQAAAVVTGEPDAVALAVERVHEHARSFVTETLPAGREAVLAVIGRNGAQINGLQSEHNVSIDAAVPRGSQAEGSVAISGSAEAVEAATAAVRAILDANAEDAVQLPCADARAALIGKGGSHMKEFLADFPDVRLRVSKDSLTARLAGPVEAVQAVKDKTLAWCAKYDAENRVVEVDRRFLPGLIGKKGAGIAALQKETGCSIDVSGDSGVVRVNGPAEKLDAAVERIQQETMAGAASLVLPVEMTDDVIGCLIGRGGETLRGIEQAHGVRVFLERADDQVAIFGSESAVVQARAAIRKLLRTAVRATAQVSYPAAGLGLLLGKGGVVIRQLQADYSVDVRVPPKTGRVLAATVDLTVRGGVEAVGRAKRALQALAAGRSLRTLTLLPEQLAELRGAAKRMIDHVAAQQGAKVDVENVAGEMGADEAEDGAELSDLTGVVSVSGSASAVEAVVSTIERTLAFRFEDSFATEPLPVGLVDELYGSGDASPWATLLAEAGAHGYLCRTGSYAVLAGPSATAVAAARAALHQQVAAWGARHAEVPLPEHVLPSFVGRKGAAIQALEKQVGCELHVNRDGDTPVVQICVEDSGKLADAVEQVTQAVRKLEGINRVVQVPSGAIPSIIGHNGETVQSIQADTGARVDVQRAENAVRVSADSEDAVAAAVARIEEIVGSLPEAALAAAEEQQAGARRVIALRTRDDIGAVLGAKGATIMRITEESGARLDLSRVEKQLVITGQEAAVAAAADAVAAVLAEARAARASEKQAKSDASKRANSREADAESEAPRGLPVVPVGAAPEDAAAFLRAAQALAGSKSQQKRTKSRPAAETSSAGAGAGTAPAAADTSAAADALLQSLMAEAVPPAPKVERTPQPVTPAKASGAAAGLFVSPQPTQASAKPPPGLGFTPAKPAAAPASSGPAGDVNAALSWLAAAGGSTKTSTRGRGAGSQPSATQGRAAGSTFTTSDGLQIRL